MSNATKKRWVLRDLFTPKAHEFHSFDDFCCPFCRHWSMLLRHQPNNNGRYIQALMCLVLPPNPKKSREKINHFVVVTRARVRCYRIATQSWGITCYSPSKLLTSSFSMTYRPLFLRPLCISAASQTILWMLASGSPCIACRHAEPHTRRWSAFRWKTKLPLGSFRYRCWCWSLWECERRISGFLIFEMRLPNKKKKKKQRTCVARQRTATTRI